MIAALGATALSGVALDGPDSGGLIYDGAFDPRAVELADRSLLVVFDHSADGRRAVAGVRSADGGKTWGRYTRITDDASRVDVSNAFPWQLPDGTILVACRYHRLNEKSINIEIYASSDNGRTWRLLSTPAHNSVGLWEPLLFQPSPRTLQVYYASEEGIHPDQRIEMKSSQDGGRTWGLPTVVARKPGSRDGMPAVVRTKKGDLLACFEASDTPLPTPGGCRGPDTRPSPRRRERSRCRSTRSSIPAWLSPSLRWTTLRPSPSAPRPSSAAPAIPARQARSLSHQNVRGSPLCPHLTRLGVARHLQSKQTPAGPFSMSHTHPAFFHKCMGAILECSIA